MAWRGSPRKEVEKPIKNKHYFQGGYDYEFEEELDRKYECPICLLCLRDPHQTSCGHRFCYSCILTWLGEGRTCPHDNSSLGEGDIYADNGINRDIIQLRARCPTAGCSAVLPVCDMSSHLRTCTQQTQVGVDESYCQDCGECMEINAQHSNIICPRAMVACPFTLVGCSQKIQRYKLQDHVEGQTVHHMQLLAEKLLKLQQLSTAVDTADQSSDFSEHLGSDSSGRQGSPSLSRNNITRGSNTKLIRESCQRIIGLEQTICQLQIRIDQLEPLLVSQTEKEEELKGKYCNGNFVWKISDFSDLLYKMKKNSTFVIYSRPFYSSVYGYKMRLRCNVTEADGEQHLGLFFHLMKGDNDDILDWPFRGSVNLTLLNQNTDTIVREHLTEHLECLELLGSFQRPAHHSNIKGFGFREFIRVSALFTGGFVKDSRLVVKAMVDSQ